MRTVITGGAGFVGTALARRLVAESELDDEIILVDTLGRHGRSAALEQLLSHPCLRIVEADLTLSESLAHIPSPVDRVYHLAARVGVGPVTSAPAEVLRVNTLSTLNVFEWFAKQATTDARLLFSSSSEVYSGAALLDYDLPVPTPEAVPAIIADLDNPRFSYALSKTWGEAYAKYLVTSADVLLASVRYHNVYGPGMGYDHVIPQIVSRVKEREDPFRMIGVDQTRAFCWIEDAVEATFLTMEAEKLTPGTVWHIGNQAEEIAIQRLYEMIFELCEWTPAEQVSVPAPAGSVARRCPDVAKLRALTGYEPTTPLSEGLRKTVNWYLEH